MTKKRFLLALALMLTAVGGAWAQGNTTPVNWNAATKTGSLTVPAGNVTLTVDYYGQYTLDSIPLDWQVKVGAAAPVSPTAYNEGNTALGHVDNINETDSVELIPPAELRGTIKAVRLTESVAPVPEPITVTWNASDITGAYSNSFTKDGVTVTCQAIDFEDKNFMNAGSNTGTFTTTLGNFTRIEVTAMSNVSGAGWSRSGMNATWTGEASSSVPFNGSIMGDMGLTIVFTIQPGN